MVVACINENCCVVAEKRIDYDEWAASQSQTALIAYSWRTDQKRIGTGSAIFCSGEIVGTISIYFCFEKLNLEKRIGEVFVGHKTYDNDGKIEAKP